MKITAVEVDDYQAIQHVEVRPGDRALVVVGGRNRQGKSSLLSALEVAFGGKRVAGPEPVRRGAKAARIAVELDGGKILIERRITKGGNWQLEIREDGVARRTPQALLDAVVGARFLDPLAFLRADAKTQRDLLLRVADVPADLGKIAADRQAAYDRRRDVNRELTRRQAERESLGPVEPTPEPLGSIALASAELQAARQRRDGLARDRVRLADIDAEGKRVRAEIERLTARLDELRAQWTEINERARRTDPKALDAEVEAADAKLVAATKAAQEGAQARGRNDRRAALEAEVADLRAKSEAEDSAIERLDAEKATALSAAKMPIPGLDVDEEQVRYGGAPLSQASDAERLQVSLAIAAALSPDLADVWVRDGSLLDAESLEAVRRFAEERKIRVWIERVGAGDDGAIVIEGGKVAASAEAAS